jgi:hypothetical protein
MVARSRAWIVIVACSPLAAVGVACGLDESGLQPSDASIGGDGGGKDVVAYDVLNDVPLPPSCATDVTCLGLGGTLPDGWAPYVGSLDGGACPPGDFTGTTWVTNSRLAQGSCACSCSTSGTFACPSTAAIALGGLNCGGNNAATTGQCITANASTRIELLDAAASGSCEVDASPPTVQTDPVTLCAIGCDAGANALCSQPQGSRCIVTDGIQNCPGGLTGYLIGASADPSCAACTCQVSGATCTATAHLYHGYLQGYYHQNSNCADSGSYTVETTTLNGTCQQFNFFDSYDVSFTPSSAPTCTVPSNAGTGDAGLASPKTVCCN